MIGAPVSIEVRTQHGWRRLDGATVEVPETGAVELRGLRSGALVGLGPVERVAPPSGSVAIDLVDEDDLRCHVGRLPVHVDGVAVGEVDVVPGKLSREAFAAMRADLERTWLGLLRDDDAPTFLPASPPDVVPLWRQLLPLVEAIKAEPRSQLVLVPGYARFDRLRRPSQLTPSAIVASARGPVVVTDVLAERPVPSDHALVADTMRRLAALARRQPGADAVVRGCAHQLAHPLFAFRGSSTTISQGARFDQRYRRVLAINSALTRADTVITEGPGDLRAGIKSLDRLYEYWVFLQVVEQLAARSGGLASGQVGQIGTRLPGRRVRLELPPGTTLRFADSTEAAFEPLVSTDPRLSWHGLELDPHPEPQYSQSHITPDVMVWLPAPPPNVVVIDAKYRGRHQIDRATVDIHARYSRLRFRGIRAVREVVAAHPHADRAYSYPGYRAMPFVPGRPVDLPASCVAVSRPLSRPDSDDATGGGGRQMLGTGPAPVTVIADQYWMHQQLGSRRIDLYDLADEALAGRSPERLLICIPPIGALAGFAAAAVRHGWDVLDASYDREGQIAAIVDAAEAAPGTVVLVSGDESLTAEAAARGIAFEQVDDLAELRDLPTLH